jgi:hypothetical protein
MDSGDGLKFCSMHAVFPADAHFWATCVIFTQIQFRDGNVQFLEPATELPCSNAGPRSPFSLFRSEGYGQGAGPIRFTAGIV